MHTASPCFRLIRPDKLTVPFRAPCGGAVNPVSACPSRQSAAWSLRRSRRWCIAGSSGSLIISICRGVRGS